MFTREHGLSCRLKWSCCLHGNMVFLVDWNGNDVYTGTWSFLYIGMELMFTQEHGLSCRLKWSCCLHRNMVFLVDWNGTDVYTGTWSLL